LSTCHASADPYSAIFDMSGNVEEWEDSCTTVSGNGGADKCNLRGGGAHDSAASLQCNANWSVKRNIASDTTYYPTYADAVGFRCCGP
jgi:formylglycine-generating enzyme required for sulfatase activity